MFPFNSPSNRKSNMTSVMSFDENNNIQDSFVIDQFAGKDFCLNQFGFPSSDITLIEKAATQKEFEVLASRLQEIEVPKVDNSKKSDRDLIKDLMPAWIQTPSEIAKFADYYNELHPVEENIDVESQINSENDKSVVESPESQES